jgi:predicted metal-binding protein
MRDAGSYYNHPLGSEKGLKREEEAAPVSGPSEGRRRIAKVDQVKAAASLRADAERYATMGVELGAAAGLVVPASMVAIDDRVALKCSVPKCFGFGTSANCPPHSPTPSQMRSAVSLYDTAVLLRWDVAPEVIVRDRATIQERVQAYKNVFSVVGRLESEAFYDGHYLSCALAAGSCRSTFCHDVECAVLAGQKCRHNLVARPSMEAVGIDCFALAAAVGWDIYPIGSSAQASEVAAGVLMGIIFVG